MSATFALVLWLALMAGSVWFIYTATAGDED